MEKSHWSPGPAKASVKPWPGVWLNLAQEWSSAAGIRRRWTKWRPAFQADGLDATAIAANIGHREDIDRLVEKNRGMLRGD